MGSSHSRSRPERKQPSEIQWMSDVSVRPWRSESQPRIGRPAQVEIDLPEPEKIEVVDQKRADQHDEPSHCEESCERETDRSVFYIPDHAAHRAPLPEEEQ